MFSINPYLNCRNGLSNALYIPLCFLLIQFWQRSCKAVNNLYIPLCFLLIVWEPGALGTESLLYIPLCFLLIQLHDILMCRANNLYIPLCFLLIIEVWFSVNCTVTLYIPLRFLLILKDIFTPLQLNPALHSTMFSINRRLRLAKTLTGGSLHSTMFSINPAARRGGPAVKNLYIPLCFLLIKPGSVRKSDQEVLYIPLCFLLILQPPSSSNRYIFSLHSTMFSINQEVFLDMSAYVPLYIPLCFLLIQWSGQACMSLINFTFHYVFY